LCQKLYQLWGFLGIFGDFWGFLGIFGDKVKSGQIPKNPQKSPKIPIIDTV
jgi:hypothetical protein